MMRLQLQCRRIQFCRMKPVTRPRMKPVTTPRSDETSSFGIDFHVAMVELQVSTQLLASLPVKSTRNSCLKNIFHTFMI